MPSSAPFSVSARVKTTRRKSYASRPYPRACLPPYRHYQISRLLYDLDDYLVNPTDDPVLPDTSSASRAPASTMDVGTQTDPVVILPAGSVPVEPDTDAEPNSGPSSPSPFQASPSYSPTSPRSPVPGPSSPASVIYCDLESVPMIDPLAVPPSELFEVPFPYKYLEANGSFLPICNCFPLSTCPHMDYSGSTE
ncbi:hypothetical protein C0J50_2218 [Silurus asotus]|uniref:Uncharacterized protein n=1 Tax=Silurus asotus TaxID=30991 RepID=A0AAD5B8J1_SILAS|nr:hypothetical protein C0J50_2218 [Silurus asotus]